MNNLDLQSTDALILMASYGLVLWPASMLIRMRLDAWIEQITQNNQPSALVNAGKIIGFLERSLMLTFILLQQYTAVGFILALKATYRFKDTGDHPQAEYMLVGTFLSLAITLAIGLLATYLIELN